MAEYYGYAERDANAYVDWGKLGENLTETVQAAYKIRTERKQKLDEVMQQNYKELADAPSGLNQDINKTITSHVGNTKEFLLRANKLLKAGVLRPEDYTLIMQNQKEDNKAIFDNAKNWQSAWATMQDAVNSGKGSRGMLDVGSDVESFGKFNNMDFMINPVTGRVNASKMIIGTKGERIKGESMTMQQLNVLMNQNIDKYDLTKVLTNAESVMGENKIATFKAARRGKNGEIIEIEDKETKASFDDAYETFAKAIKANPFNTMSILIDHQGAMPSDSEIDAMLNAKPPLITAAEADSMKTMAKESYRLSTNPADKDKPNVIYYQDKEGDGSRVPILNDTQKKVVDKYIKDQFLGLIDHKETKGAVAPIGDYHKTEGEGSAETKKYNGEMFGQNVANAVYGKTQEDIDKGLRGMAGLGNIKYVTKEGNTLYVYTDKNEPSAYTLTDDNKDDVFNQIIQGAAEQAGANNYIDPSAAKMKALQIVKERGYTKVGNFKGATTDRRPKATETKASGAGDDVFK